MVQLQFNNKDRDELWTNYVYLLLLVTSK